MTVLMMLGIRVLMEEGSVWIFKMRGVLGIQTGKDEHNNVRGRRHAVAASIEPLLQYYIYSACLEINAQICTIQQLGCMISGNRVSVFIHLV